MPGVRGDCPAKITPDRNQDADHRHSARAGRFIHSLPESGEPEHKYANSKVKRDL